LDLQSQISYMSVSVTSVHVTSDPSVHARALSAADYGLPPTDVIRTERAN